MGGVHGKALTKGFYQSLYYRSKPEQALLTFTPTTAVIFTESYFV